MGNIVHVHIYLLFIAYGTQTHMSRAGYFKITDHSLFLRINCNNGPTKTRNWVFTDLLAPPKVTYKVWILRIIYHCMGIAKCWESIPPVTTTGFIVSIFFTDGCLTTKFPYAILWNLDYQAESAIYIFHTGLVAGAGVLVSRIMFRLLIYIHVLINSYCNKIIDNCIDVYMHIKQEQIVVIEKMFLSFKEIITWHYIWQQLYNSEVTGHVSFLVFFGTW